MDTDVDIIKLKDAVFEYKFVEAVNRVLTQEI